MSLRSRDTKSQSRKQLEIIAHKSLFDVLEPTHKAVDESTTLDLLVGAKVEMQALVERVATVLSASDTADPEVELVRKALSIIGSPQKLVQ